jgi:hypothetical protein
MQNVKSAYAPRSVAGSALLSFVFVLTLALSAILIFVSEPALAKMLLPSFGGSPAVWNTALVFFQGALLAGYVYAHLLSTYAPFKVQLTLHAAFLAAAAMTLPLGLSPGWTPNSEASPVLAILAQLSIAAGLPFILLSATAPLLQAWFARTRSVAASDPYFLYAASNAGSLAALIAYPTLIEPYADLDRQFRLWFLGFMALCLLIAGCGLFAIQNAVAKIDVKDPPAIGGPDTENLSLTRRLRWVALSFVP